MTELTLRLPIKLGQLLKLSGIAESGAHATDLIAHGEVTINGEVRTERGAQVRDGDIVEAFGEQIRVVSE